GEVGRLGTDSSTLYSEKFEIKEEYLTKPEEALKYLQETKADLLAISMGNFHGIEISGIDPNLRLDVLKAVKDKVGNALFVLHGGSGTPEDDMKEAIKMGIVKININTELRLAFSGKLRKALNADPEEITPYKFLVDAEAGVKEATRWKINMFGSGNKI
ncbi:MAG: class II fructose-bisphosphate aldolase, partial [Candidatus Staskawiczbacteria bacterium]|nr:class II fructose-bisphosphate aldolase [Candidatus Staskawiczbacteria bacterium]